MSKVAKASPREANLRALMTWTERAIGEGRDLERKARWVEAQMDKAAHDRVTPSLVGVTYDDLHGLALRLRAGR